MTDLSLDLKNSIADLQTRHAALITAVQTYRNGSVGASKAEITAAAAALESRLNTEESALLGLAGRGVQPSLSMDFIKDMYLMGDTRPKKGYNFADLITFTRASIGTSFNSAGTLVSNAVNVPRFDYDPITKALKGLLIEEGRTNMAPYSEFLDRWSKIQVTVIPNAAIAPDGTLNACKVVSSTAASWHILNSAAMSVTSGWQYTISLYAKAAEMPRVRICFNDSTVFTGSSTFDLTTGLRTSGTSGTITPVGNGWYRVTFTATALKSVSSIAMALNPVKAGETDALSPGDDVSGIYIWGAQCEAGAMETSYIPTATNFVSRTGNATWFNSSGLMQTAVAGAARSDAYGYDSAGVLKPIGLLLESAATNLLKSSQSFANVIWNKNGSPQVAVVTENAVVAPDGTMTGATVSLNAPVPGDDCNINQQYSTTSGTAYCGSFYIKATSAAGIGKQVMVRHAGNTAYTVVTLTANWVRVALSELSNSGIAVFSIGLRPALGGSAGAVSMDIWGAQAETGSFPTSYIPTTTAQVTRAADVATSAQVTRAHDVASVNTMSPWFNGREGTLTAEFSQRTPPITGTFRRVTALVGPNLDEIAIYMSGAAGMMNGFIRGIGAVQTDSPAAGAAALGVDEVRRAAIAYKENDVSFSTLALSMTDTTAIMPTGVNSLIIGGNSSNLQRWCGHMRMVRYYPVRLTTAQIKVLSA